MMARRVLLLLTCLLAAFPAILAEGSPAKERGFRADGVYQFHGVDSVSLFNGNLNMTVPLGQPYPLGGNLSYSFVLRYSGNVWRFTEHCLKRPVGSIECGYRFIAHRDNAGMGWQLSFGELLPAEDGAAAGSTVSFWRFRSSDGAEHVLYGTLHEPRCGNGVVSNCDPVVEGFRYSRDETYLRLRDAGSAVKVLEFGNGTRHRYEYDSTRSEWHLRYIYDVFSPLDAAGVPAGHYLRIDRVPGASAGVTDWELRDSSGRVHRVYFRAAGEAAAIQVVDKVEMTGFGGNATYDLVYNSTTNVDGAPKTLARPCGALGGTATSNVLLLSRILLPTGESFAFRYDEPSTSCDDKSGTLTEATLPTLARIAWSYSQYVPDPAGDNALGIVQRVAYDPLGAILSKTTYDVPVLGTRIVTDYAKDSGGTWGPHSKTVHYFQADATAPNAHVYTLPFTTEGMPGVVVNPDPAGRYLSSVTHGRDATGTCCNTPMRASYVKYEMDAVTMPPCGSDLPCIRDRNRRVVSESTRFLDDGDRYASVDRSDFDGLGHYRQSTTGGNFGSGDVRTTFANFNVTSRGGQSVGTYALNADGSRAAGFTMLGTTDPWILDTFTQTSVQEGAETAVVQSCFDRPTGFLLRRRTLAGSAPGPKDLLSVFTPENGSGAVAREEYFGGDRQTLATSALCTMALPSHDTSSFRIDHQYVYGSLQKSRYYDAAGAALPFFVTDNDIHAMTGLVERSRDTAGVETVFSYDVAGRLTRVVPSSVAATEYTYRPASIARYSVSSNGTAEVRDVYHPAQVEARSTRPDGKGVTQAYEYDPLGRLWREKKLMPGGTWSVRQTDYNGSLREAVSETASVQAVDPNAPAGMSPPDVDFVPQHKTRFLSYDSFGRPGRIVAADGKETTLSYIGARRTLRTLSVMTAPGVTTNVSTTEELDRAGRLIQVIENSTGSSQTTTYTYGVGGQLASVTMPGTVTQTRRFDNDNRGFLVSETHPESGTTNYEYDARGHVVSRNVGSCEHGLRFAYDAAERLRLVETRRPYDCEGFPANGASFYTFKEFTHGTTAGPSLGKLLRGVRHNYLPLGDVIVKDEYTYDTAGFLTEKLTIVQQQQSTAYPPETLQVFRQTYEYDAEGQLFRAGYPHCWSLPGWSSEGCGQSHFGYVRADHEHGLPTRVSAESRTAGGSITPYDDIASIEYHPGGLRKKIVHDNGVIDDIEAAPEAIGRPLSFTYRGLSEEGCEPLAITGHPQSQSVASGSTVTLAVTATGTSLTYQWYRNGQAVPNATSSTHTTGAITQAEAYYVVVGSACGSVPSQSATITPQVVAAPTGTQATASFQSQWRVTVTWISSGTAQYEVARRMGGGGFTVIGTSPTTSYIDTGCMAGMTCVYRVRAVSGGAASSYSNPDHATTMQFLPVAGQPVALAQFQQLLDAVNAIRGAVGAGALTWSAILPANVPAPASGGPVRAVYVQALRDQMSAALQALAIPAGTYSGQVVAGQTKFEAAHLAELQERAK